MAEELRVLRSSEVERLRPFEVFLEIINGIGIALGLSLLWVMEAVRDRVFRVLDWANVRPRTRRSSAFPPGQPRKRPTRRART
jgi:hypothetical protein